MSEPRPLFDSALLASRRNRAAGRAADHDFLLRRVADDLTERLAIVKRDFPVALDLGSHHGVLGRQIGASPNVGRLISLDPSARLLAQAPAPRVQGALEALPFAPASFDLVISGLSLQLVDDLPGTLFQIRHVLKPDGLLLAAVLGGQTLKELREAWLLAEDDLLGGASPRVAPFADVRDLGGLLQRAGFALPVADSDTVAVTYADPLALMRDIKGMGASNMLLDRRRVPATRRLLMRAAEIYVERFGLAGGRVPATFEILTLTAWAPHESQPKPLKPGSAQARLADALGVPERKA
ncbi:methyltransferase domain-containing protein [Hyphomicrobium sp. LHD-15]|uniref:methyltransferase domain-containing protein n=1 Tax=Hyphomicrobium sp. LHD-15 TaxID=3072142 RepID=UPI00280DB91B|nr:methyltransferase domain-containing protein [Hyphomicrobium sp. LHD-15]MDQ8699907.1 methyltransferase domain-containing protein [Hyphomicrobium sp. LHD-15]